MVADGFMRQFRTRRRGGLCATEHIFHGQLEAPERTLLPGPPLGVADVLVRAYE